MFGMRWLAKKVPENGFGEKKKEMVKTLYKMKQLRVDRMAVELLKKGG